MFINVPEKLTKKDIKNCGIIYKDEDFSYVLSDIKNTDKNKLFTMNGYGFFNYVYNICNTYLFIIGNQIKNKDIKIKDIDFLSKILKFEYNLQNNSKKIQRIDIPSKVFTILPKKRWLKDDFMGVNGKLIDDIIKIKKTYLQAYKTPYERHLRYLCSENSLGTFKHGLCKDLLTQDYIHIFKDTSIDGYIIKTDNRQFI